MELRRVPVARGQSRQPFYHGVTNHLELAIGQGITGQCVHREQGAEHLAVLKPGELCLSLSLLLHWSRNLIARRVVG
jgi:hypothetical protein